MKFPSLLGLVAGVLSIITWVIVIFFNPYTDHNPPFGLETILLSFILFFIPACLAIFSSLTAKKLLMLLTFFSSLPSLYLAILGGIYALFGITSISYFISYIFMRVEKIRVIKQ